MRTTLILAALLSLSPAVHAQPTVEPPPETASALTLSPDQKVKPGQLVRVTAESKGAVVFAVVPIGGEPLDYEADGKRVIFAAPPAGQTVLVLAVAVVDAKVTPFARCTVVSIGELPRPPPQPDPGPGPQPAPATAAKFVSVLIDYNAGPAPPAYVSGAGLRQALQQRGVSLTVLSATAEEVRRRRLDLAAKPAGGLPAIILQDAAGRVLAAVRLPATEAEFLALLGVP